MDKCSQKNCDNDATMKYFWPGEDVRLSCTGCMIKIQSLGRVLGITVPTLPHNQTQREQIPTGLPKTTE